MSHSESTFTNFFHQSNNHHHFCKNRNNRNFVQKTPMKESVTGSLWQHVRLKVNYADDRDKRKTEMSRFGVTGRGSNVVDKNRKSCVRCARLFISGDERLLFAREIYGTLIGVICAGKNNWSSFICCGKGLLKDIWSWEQWGKTESTFKELFKIKVKFFLK